MTAGTPGSTTRHRWASETSESQDGETGLRLRAESNVDSVADIVEVKYGTGVASSVVERYVGGHVGGSELLDGRTTCYALQEDS